MKPPAAGNGRPKGAVNKTTTMLKEAILQAGENAGGKEGLIGYLTRQATEEPVAFMGMLGKVLPHTIAGDPNAPLQFEEIRRVIVDPGKG